MKALDSYFVALANTLNSYKALNTLTIMTCLKMLEEIKTVIDTIDIELEKVKAPLQAEITKQKEEIASLKGQISEAMKKNAKKVVIDDSQASS